MNFNQMDHHIVLLNGDLTIHSLDNEEFGGEIFEIPKIKFSKQ